MLFMKMLGSVSTSCARFSRVEADLSHRTFLALHTQRPAALEAPASARRVRLPSSRSW